MEDHSSGMEQVSILLCSELTITKINKTLRDHVSSLATFTPMVVGGYIEQPN